MAYTVLITGGTGSWAHELVRQLIDKPEIDKIIIYSRGEHRQVEMKRQFSDKLHRLQFFIGDVRDLGRLQLAMRNVKRVYHMAALKHVPVCEENPWEAIQTNIEGTHNAIQAAVSNGVERFVFVSTDKAVDPLSLYGTTKAAAEKLVISANLQYPGCDFICVRAGNVLGTNGSVIPLFLEQLRKTNALTLTRTDMTRFFLRVEDAIQLVLRAEKEAVGGEIMVIKMPACKILDLARVMIRVFGNEKSAIREIGLRPGEKIHEVLVSRYETTRLIAQGEWFVILPMLPIPKIAARYGSVAAAQVGEEYSSLNALQLNDEGIKRLLELGGFLKQDYVSELSSLPPDDLLRFFEKEGWLHAAR